MSTVISFLLPLSLYSDLLHMWISSDVPLDFHVTNTVILIHGNIRFWWTKWGGTSWIFACSPYSLSHPESSPCTVSGVQNNAMCINPIAMKEGTIKIGGNLCTVFCSDQGKTKFWSQFWVWVKAMGILRRYWLRSELWFPQDDILSKLQSTHKPPPFADQKLIFLWIKITIKAHASRKNYAHV